MRKLALTLSAALLLTGCTTGGDSGGTFAFHSPGGQTEITYEPAERKPVGAIQGETLTGEPISLSDFDGQIVVLNAWGQWCAPCRAEVDDLQQIQERLRDDGSGNPIGTVLGINVRDPNPQIALDFMRDNGVTYPSIYDPPFKTAAALGGVPSSVIPTTVVLDSQHRPAAVFLREVNAQDILDVVDTLLNEEA